MGAAAEGAGEAGRGVGGGVGIGVGDNATPVPGDDVADLGATDDETTTGT